jgi:competence protein ComEA
MRTELPAQRLHRRLGATGESESEDAEAADASSALSRWLPTSPETRTGWLATVRADPGRAGLFALGAVAVIAVMITVVAMMRDKPPPVASAKLPPVQMVSSATPKPSTTAPPVNPDQPVVVSVVGLVHKPGLATLQPGARIADAVAAAGGTQDGADVIGLNMAQRVADGEQIVVGIAPARGEPTKLGSAVTPASGGPSSSTSASPSATGKPTGGPLDLNTATAEQLDALPGVGPVTAAAIVAWRDANGKFSSVDQLGDVDGIGPARLEKLRSLVRV